MQGDRWSSQPDGVPSTALAGVHRGLVSTALLWQPLWVLTQSSLWPTAQPGPAPIVALAAVGISWVLLLATHLTRRSVRWPVRISIATLLMATLAVNVAQLRSTTPDFGPVAEMAGLAAGIAGLLLSRRWGVVWTILLLIPLIRDALTAPDAGSRFPVLLAYVLALGLSAVAVRWALERNAAAADAASDALFAAERQRFTAQQVERSLRETERRLHETVLNTLVAIGRGGLPDEGAGTGFRARCVESSRLLTSLRGRTDQGEALRLTGDLASDVASATAQVRDVGADVEWELDAFATVPRDVYAAVRSGVAEALLNVARHAGARRVNVRSSTTRRGADCWVRIEVSDDGAGFDTSTNGARFGITEAILSPMAEVGGTAAVEAEPGQGTRVVLEWRDTTDPRPPTAVTPAALSVPLLATAGLYVLTIVAVTWSAAARPAVNALALATFAVAAGGLAVWTLRARLPWGAVGGVAVLGWVVYALQSVAAGGQMSLEWSSSAVAVLFMVAAATGPRWSWLLLVAVWLVIQGDPLHEITQPGTALILVGALLGRSTRRNAALAGAHGRERREAEAARESARVQLDLLGRRYSALAVSRAPELLLGLAEGDLSAQDPAVRERAVREERFIRTVIGVDPSVDALHEVVSTLAQRAHGRGVLLDIDLAASPHPGMALPVPFMESCEWAMRHAAITLIVQGQPVGTTARLSSRAEGDDIVLRALVPLARTVDLSCAPEPGEMVDPDDAAGAVCLWEIVLPGDRVAEQALA